MSVACVSPAGVEWSGRAWRVRLGRLELPPGVTWTWSAHHMLGAAALLNADALGAARPRVRCARDGTVTSFTVGESVVASLRAWHGDDEEQEACTIAGARALARDVVRTCAALGVDDVVTSPATLAARALDVAAEEVGAFPRRAPPWASVFAGARGPLGERLVGGRVEALDLGELDGPASYWDRRSAYVAELLEPLPSPASYTSSDAPDLAGDGYSWAVVRVPRMTPVPVLSVRAALPVRGSVTVAPVGTLRGRWTHAELRTAEEHGARILSLGPGLSCELEHDPVLMAVARRVLNARAAGCRAARGVGVALVGRLQGSSATRSALLTWGTGRDMGRATIVARDRGAALGHLRLGGVVDEPEMEPGWHLRTSVRLASPRSLGAPWVDTVTAAHVVGAARLEAARVIMRNLGRVRLVATDGVLLRGHDKPAGTPGDDGRPGAWVERERGTASRVSSAVTWALRRRGKWIGPASDGWDVFRQAAESLPWETRDAGQRPAVVAGRAPGGGPVEVQLAGGSCPVPVVVVRRPREPFPAATRTTFGVDSKRQGVPGAINSEPEDA